MVMVGTDPAEVERALCAGELACPSCSARLRPWGYARVRSARSQGEGGVVRHRPRRSVCSGCSRTHVLMPACWLPRRADAVSVIGAALVAKALGRGHRRIAVGLGRPVSTVRGWLRRFAANADALGVLFTRLLHALDPQAAPVMPTGSVFADAVEVIGRAASAAVLRLSPSCPWELAARASAGRLLAPVAPGCGGRGAQHELTLGSHRRTGQPQPLTDSRAAGSAVDREVAVSGSATRAGIEDDDRRRARARDVGLFRYALIREAADGGLTNRERGRLVRQLAGTEHVGPFGEKVRVSRASLDRWIRAWRAGGFDALVPAPAQRRAPHPGGGAGPGGRVET